MINETAHTTAESAAIDRAAMAAELGKTQTIAKAVEIHTAGMSDDELRPVLYRLAASHSAAIKLGGCDCDCEKCDPDEDESTEQSTKQSGRLDLRCVLGR
ncbi:hypothetical protein FZI91_14730 [Mycobacterium sp. CBMA271]|uniref:hypothetical protein n=1 Tax=unclassified Mycobacteroides TaxID=2618759 RepID=UPI0012DBE264|nr:MULTISPECIES: hypothetical protein [unclassified Mycobacteroides]MUM17773.1 hypothetical protein [Mycobacteroides sp. CBMA 326]MUM22953.1 hypothetical protein [Mycobacteroides sp. CBMA 271]